MRVFIQSNEQGFPDNINCYNAYSGFDKLYADIVLFQHEEQIFEATPEDIIVSHVGIVRNHLKRLGFDYPEICYPEELKQYLGRNVELMNLSEVIRKPEKWPVFIKPVKGKLFVGTVVRNAVDLIDVANLPNDTKIYSSNVIDIVSEWRAFVRYGEVVDVRHYNGDWTKIYNPKVIKDCVSCYNSAPAGYGMDFGVTKQGETVLIEVNEGYSLGCYGLYPVEYAKLISARWAQLTNTEDQFNF